MTSLIANWKARARELKIQVYALYLAYRDPRVPLYARIFAALVVGYAFSPIDLIPDPIPVLGYLDDLIIVPAGIALTLRLIPPEVLADARARAADGAARSLGRVGAAVIVALWLALAAAALWLVWRWA